MALASGDPASAFARRRSVSTMMERRRRNTGNERMFIGRTPWLGQFQPVAPYLGCAGGFNHLDVHDGSFAHKADFAQDQVTDVELLAR